MEGHGRAWKGTEGHGRAWKGMEQAWTGTEGHGMACKGMQQACNRHGGARKARMEGHGTLWNAVEGQEGIW